MSKNLLESLNMLGWRTFEGEAKENLRKIFRTLDMDLKSDRKTLYSILVQCFNMFEVEKSSGTGIRVMGVLDSSGIESRITFFGGASAEDLPAAANSEEFFLPDKLKENLNLNHFNLRVARERLDIRRLVRGNEKIFFSWPSRVGGRPGTKSVFLYDYPEEQVETKIISAAGGGKVFMPSFEPEKFMKKYLRDGLIEIGVTGLEEMARCPYRFYLERVEGIERYSEPVIEEVPALWGIIIHKAMSEATLPYIGEKIEVRTVKEQVRVFRERALFYLDKPEEIKNERCRISPLVKTFLGLRLETVTDTYDRLLRVHLGHKILAVEEPVSCVIGKLRLKGRFDRREEGEGVMEIIDAKTGKESPVVSVSKFEESQDPEAFFKLGSLQLALYCLMAHKNFSADAESIVWKFSFENGKAKEKKYVFKPELLKRLEENIAQFSEILASGNFSFTPRDNVNCYMCNFKDFCFMSRETP